MLDKPSVSTMRRLTGLCYSRLHALPYCKDPWNFSSWRGLDMPSHWLQRNFGCRPGGQIGCPPDSRDLLWTVNGTMREHILKVWWRRFSGSLTESKYVEQSWMILLL